MLKRPITKMICVMSVAIILLLGFGQAAQAALSSVGVVDPANGFPASYTDGSNLALAPCLTPNPGDPVNNPFCVVATDCVPPDTPPACFDAAQPIVFPTNFPAELFYWIAEATLDVGPALAEKAVFRAALEGSFLTGYPITPGDQVTFLRLNLQKMSGLTPNSTYTVTHPFGTFDFATDALGDTLPGGIAANQAFRAEDGCAGPPCDFTVLLPAPTTAIGPFLTAVTPAPVAGFIGNPAITQTITPGPNGAIFKIDGPDIGGTGVISKQTDQWTLAGQLFTNPPPLAANDAAAAVTAVLVNIPVLANDAARLGATLDVTSVVILTNPGSGTASVNPDGTVDYTSNPGFAATDSFTYTVSDSLAVVSNAATVTITVSPPNTPPVAVNDAATTKVGVPVDIPVLANDTDTDNFPIAPATVIVSNPLNGTAVASISGTVHYTPTAGFVGEGGFTYTVADTFPAISNAATVTVTVTNTPPAAANDTATTSLLNTPVLIDVLANDSDPDVGGALNPATVVAGPASNGAVLVNPATGVVTYTPNVNYVGTDSFSYTVQDNLGSVSNSATVTVTVAGPLDVITVTTAQFAGKKGKWAINGTCSTPGSTLTARVGPDFAGSEIGSAVANKRGKFKIKANRSIVTPGLTNTIRLQSSNGSLSPSFPVSVK